MKEIELWRFISSKLSADKPIILLIVVDSSKSSPGRTGFKMAAASDGDLIGTIGGGIMEGNLLAEARIFLEKNQKVNHIKKLFHNKNAKGEKSGLICGGTQTMIIKSLDESDIPIINKILTSFENLKRGLLVFNQRGISFLEEKVNEAHYNFSYHSKSRWKYEENSGFPDTVYVIGGGHVGLAVSKAMSLLDFYVVTIDPRKDVFTMANNTYADKKLYIQYKEVGDYIIEGDRSYAVVVTSEHDADLAALKSIIKKDLKYIGLMGSKLKIKSIFNGLTEAGFDPKLCSKVHTPIGIEIKAESPAEIAVSIAAEIIKVKNSR